MLYQKPLILPEQVVTLIHYSHQAIYSLAHF
jgi:hypothetical protein